MLCTFCKRDSAWYVRALHTTRPDYDVSTINIMLAAGLTMHSMQNSSAFKWFSRTRPPMIYGKSTKYRGFVKFKARGRG